jgi:hypothetical protein
VREGDMSETKKLKGVFALYSGMPLSIAFNVIAIVAKLIGSVASIGMPYGVYCIYKVVVSLKSGMEFSQIHQVTFVWLLVVLPIAAFFLHFIADKLYHYFFRNSI